MSSRIQTLALVVLGAPVLALALAATANADTIHVCWDGSGDYLTIREGIDAAQDGDEVVVCDGTYTGSGNKDLDFHGKDITVRSASGDPDLCIIDCEGSDSDPHRGFYLHSGETAVVDGFTITGGYGSDAGGGIYCEDAQVTITNCTVSGNQAGWSGAGVYCDGGQATISNCTISGNQVQGANENSGGGVCCWFGSLTITNCTINSNAAPFAGGGVCCWHGSLTITHCTISGNQADAGGGVCWFDCQATITNCTISGNEALGGGGVAHAYGDQTRITNCTISGNQASWGGGGVYSHASTEATVTNCTISGNQAGELGGGVHYEGCSATIANCAIADNAANGGNGGGINFVLSDESPVVTNCLITGNTAAGSGGGLCYDWVCLGEPTLTNCTFARNAAAEYGGAVYCYFHYATTGLSMTNCILRADLAAEGAEIALRNSAKLTTSFSDVQGGEAQVYVDEGSELIWGAGNIDADPLFVDPDNDDYHLSAGSACIDTGDPDFVAGPDERDIDGHMRVWDGDDDDECVVDMGSDEFASIIPGDLDRDGCVDHSDLGILLGDWGCTGGDMDCSGHTDQADLGILLAHWGEGCP